ncbi:MAG: ATP-binding protein [Bacteroidales bacterium]|jgi:predicted AAA+ superfamily ATPase|nr:ATP-binding protein [Bacteroidales bacterium]
MKWIERKLEKQFSEEMRKGKVTVLYGGRRVGKTSLIERYLSKQKHLKCFSGTGDDADLRNILCSESLSTINIAFKGYDVVFIDEAQRIPKIGQALKLLIDSNPEMKIIASGSSSFELANRIGEPLTGRQKTYSLFPLSIDELVSNFGAMPVIQNLNQYLIYGSYPEILTLDNQLAKKQYLTELRNAYLFKDILELENIRNSAKLVDLLKLIAFQIGNEVSLNELSKSLGIAKQTVERYLDLLEKTFTIIRIRAYSTNQRKEISKSSRYYFWDNGVRNSIIQNFNDPSTRMDMGMLWENFCFVERLKKQHYQNIFSNTYFWRSYDQQEVDMIEERDGSLFAFEFKWNPNKKAKAPKGFAKLYPDAKFECISPANFLEFLN